MNPSELKIYFDVQKWCEENMPTVVGAKAAQILAGQPTNAAKLKEFFDLCATACVEAYNKAAHKLNAHIEGLEKALEAKQDVSVSVQQSSAHWFIVFAAFLFGALITLAAVLLS